MTSQTMMATAAVQNTRLLLPVAVTCGACLRELPPFGANRCRCHYCVLGRGVLSPQYPRQQECAETHRHVGDVERRPSRVAQTDIDEVDDAERRAHSIDQIA